MIRNNGTQKPPLRDKLYFEVVLLIIQNLTA